jgi:hypothetical protein
MIDDIETVGINLGQLKSMIDEIDSMTPEEHQHIIKILRDSGINYTENDNGIFAKVNQLSLDDIYRIYKYVNDVRKTRSKLETAIRSIEESLINADNDTEKHNSVTGECSKLVVDDWKKDVINKMRTETRSRGGKKKKVATVE